MRYRTIVADPPWPHEATGLRSVLTEGDRKGGVSDRRFRYVGGTPPPYSTMSVEDIAALPVKDLADKDAHLYLWVTQRYLRDVWGVAEAWGFTASCLLTWCKPPEGFGLGGTYMSNTEFVLFARRGSLPAARRVDSRWFVWPRTKVKRRAADAGVLHNFKHSRKPDAFLDLVESVSPGPRLEMFARRQRLGWDTWGNEALQHVAIGGEHPERGVVSGAEDSASTPDRKGVRQSDSTGS